MKFYVIVLYLSINRNEEDSSFVITKRLWEPFEGLFKNQLTKGRLIGE